MIASPLFPVAEGKTQPAGEGYALTTDSKGKTSVKSIHYATCSHVPIQESLQKEYEEACDVKVRSEQRLVSSGLLNIFVALYSAIVG